MEIVLVDKYSLRIKSKKTTLIVDATSMMSKTPCDGVIFLKDQKPELSKTVDYRVVITSAGEYEVGGIKIKANKDKNNDAWYILIIDSLTVLLGSANVLSNQLDKLSTCHVAVIKADSKDIQPIIATCAPSMAVIYGDIDNADFKDQNQIVDKKINISSDKLPENTQVVILK